MKVVNNIYEIVEIFEYEEPNKKESDNLTEALEQFEARFGAYEIGDLISSDENDFPLFELLLVVALVFLSACLWILVLLFSVFMVFTILPY